MRIVRIGGEDYTLNITVSSLRTLDALRPGQDMIRLSALLETTTGLLDLAQAASGMDREQLATQLLRHLNEIPALRDALAEEIVLSMRMESSRGERGVIDLTLEELKINEKDGGLSYRRLVSLGLSSGLSLTEMLSVTPGMVCDLFLYRQAYDDQLHGIARKKQQVYDV